MQKGPKLDALVAEHIYGLDITNLRPYSSDIAAAWEVAERICERGFRLQLEGSKFWQARFYKQVSHTLETRASAATARDASAAICSAALAVIGVELPD